MNNIYTQIAQRTNGNIYLGVVGPVRTGKSTFITRFMEKMVLPNLPSGVTLNRTKDELPQSGSGNLIMTMQPRFVPSEAVDVVLDKMAAKVRLVDSVGYLIDGVSGHINEDGSPRMVKTPWAEEAIPFSKAAEVGTSKVINDHSTIGIIVTTDGSITGIDRSLYTPAEERVVRELKALNKPFVIVLNTLNPDDEETKNLVKAMEEKYGAKVIAENVSEMEEQDFVNVLELVLYEFPITSLEFIIPEWARSLSEDNEIITKIIGELSKVEFNKMADYKLFTKVFGGDEEIISPILDNIDLATGVIQMTIGASNSLYYKTLSTLTGATVNSSKDLMNYIIDASRAKREYEKIETAMQSATENGYGVVVPSLTDMNLKDPEIVNKNNSSGVKLKASAPSYHILKVDVETEVTPAVGGNIELPNGSQDKTIEGEENDTSIWNTSVFGRTLTEIAHDGIITKLNTFPKEAETKLRKTVTKITNEGKGGIICILL